MEQVQTRLASLQTTVNDELEATMASINDVFESADLSKDKETTKKHVFGEKRFSIRTSVLSKMLLSKDFQTLYNIALTILLWLGVNILVQDIHSIGRPNFDLLLYVFAKNEIVFATWCFQMVSAFGVIFLVKAIAAFKIPMSVWLVPYLLYWLGVMWVIPTTICFQNDLPPASGLIVMCEAARLSMKVHAYLREKLLYGVYPDSQAANYVPDWAAKLGVTKESLRSYTISVGDWQTELGRYVYFLFAPTLVYRDSYPRSRKSIRWIQVVIHFLNVIGAIALTFLIFRTMCTPYFEATALHPGDMNTFTMSVFRSMVPGMLVLLLAFFGVLHSWFNMWSELLTFGDRRFYEDWWNAHSFATYYRKWNVVVHEWLLYYVYHDIVRFSRGRVPQFFAQMLVFVLSAILHEVILASAMGFLYPVLLLMFGGPGVFFTRLGKSRLRFFNVFMWAMLSIGMGLLMVLYSREYYARKGFNVPAEVVEAEIPDHFLAPLIPRSYIAYRMAHDGRWDSAVAEANQVREAAAAAAEAAASAAMSAAAAATAQLSGAKA